MWASFPCVSYGLLDDMMQSMWWDIHDNAAIWGVSLFLTKQKTKQKEKKKKKIDANGCAWELYI